MSQQYGIEVHNTHQPAEQPPSRYLVLVDNAATGMRIARLFLDSRREVAQFDAASSEVLSLIGGLSATHDASQPVWDQALAGHSPLERAGADIYDLGP